MAPPCGTSGYFPGKIRFMRVCIFAGSTPQPDWTAIYCLPSTSNDTGTAATPDPVGNSHRILPVLASKARNLRSLVPPANSSPPAVASTAPQLNDGKLVVVYFFSAVEVPRLQLADVVGAGDHLHHVFRDSHEALALHVFRRFAGEFGAQVVVGGNVEQARLRAVGDRRPILAAPQARAELGGLVGAGLACLIDIRPPGLGIETLEYVLAHVGLAGDEVDLVVGALELPEVTVACDVDEALHGSSISLVVEDDRRRDFVPIPGIIGMILEVAFDRAAGGVEGH